MGLKDALKPLERLAKGDVVAIPQPGGEPPARFPASAMRDAFMTNAARVRGEDVPEHPLSAAAARSTDARWRESFMATMPVSEDVPDLSDP